MREVTGWLMASVLMSCMVCVQRLSRRVEAVDSKLQLLDKVLCLPFSGPATPERRRESTHGGLSSYSAFALQRATLNLLMACQTLRPPFSRDDAQTHFNPPHSHHTRTRLEIPGVHTHTHAHTHTHTTRLGHEPSRCGEGERQASLRQARWRI